MAFFISIKGFRANFSTHSCLAQLIFFILRGMDKEFHTEMILVDLQKAFDTLDHTVLLQKMEYIGFKKSFIIMVSIISLTEDFFGTRKCLLRCWTNKKWWSAKNYLRATLLPNI